jgi:hypothetical protein
LGLGIVDVSKVLIRRIVVIFDHVDGARHVPELRPPTVLLFILQMIHEYGEPRWNSIDRGKPKNSEENLSSCNSVHDKSHIDWPGRERGPPQ